MLTSSPSSSTDEPLSRRLLAPLCLTVFAVLVHGNAIGPLTKTIADDLGTSVALIGQISTVLFSMMAICGLLVGPLADHFGHRRAILTGQVVLIASALIMSLAPSYPVLLLGGLIAGLGAATMAVPFAVVAVRATGAAQRLAMSRIQAAQTLGSILGAPILTAVAAATIWRGAYVLVLAVYVLAMLLVIRILPPDLRLEGRFSARSVLAAYRPLLHDRTMMLLLSATALRAIGWLGPFVYLGAFYDDEYGFSLRQIGLAFMIASGGMFLGNLLAGSSRMERFDLRRVFAMTTGLMGFGWFAVFVLPISAPIAVIVTTMATSAAGVSWIAMTVMLARETSAGAGTTMTVNASLFALGSALGSAIGGLLLGLGGYSALGAVLPLFLLASCVLVLQPRTSPAPALGRG